MVRCFVLLLLASFVLRAADPSARALAHAAEKAQNSGQLVRAYLLYAEAAARDPNNEGYRVNRERLKPLSQLLIKAGVESEPNRQALLAEVPPEEPLPEVDVDEKIEMNKLQPVPKLAAKPGLHSFHIRGDARTLYQAVVSVYSVRVVFDPQLEAGSSIRLNVDDVDLKGALEAVAECTDTFVFPLSADTVFVARDTPQKRDQYEPQIAVTVPLPDIVDEKSTTEVANAVRQAFDLRHIGMDSAARTVVIRDKLSKAKAAQSMLETLIRPPAQVAVDVQIYAIDDSSTLQYGMSPPTLFPMLNLGEAVRQGLVSIPQGFTNFVTFGGGRTLFGIGIADAQAFASFSKSRTKILYEATLTVSSGQTAQLHVGDKFPIAQALYTGASQLSNPFQGPLPQIQQVDLGVLIKVKPALHGDGDISMDVHAEYQALGTQTFNTVPAILQRQFEGTVRLHTGQWAILAGLDTQTSSISRTGVAGLSNIPGVGNLFSDINRTTANSQTLMVLKPHPLRDWPAGESREFFLGEEHGRRVLL